MVKAASSPLSILLDEDVYVFKLIVLLFQSHSVLFLAGKKKRGRVGMKQTRSIKTWLWVKGRRELQYVSSGLNGKIPGSAFSQASLWFYEISKKIFVKY